VRHVKEDPPVMCTPWHTKNNNIGFKNCVFVVADAEKVDIGLPHYRSRRTDEVRERRQVVKENKKNVELERACRLRTCERTHYTSTLKGTPECFNHGQVKIRFPLYPTS